MGGPAAKEREAGDVRLRRSGSGIGRGVPSSGISPKPLGSEMKWGEF